MGSTSDGVSAGRSARPHHGSAGNLIVQVTFAPPGPLLLLVDRAEKQLAVPFRTAPRRRPA